MWCGCFWFVGEGIVVRKVAGYRLGRMLNVVVRKVAGYRLQVAGCRLLVAGWEEYCM
jgi:hypothetical protein